MITVAVFYDSRLTTVEIENHSKDILSGLFFSNFIPSDNVIKHLTVQIDGGYTTSFITEKDAENSVYGGRIANRIIFDYPHDFSGLKLNPKSKITIKFQTDLPLNDDLIWHIVAWIQETQTAVWGFN